jgi:hypothetical protein
MFWKKTKWSKNPGCFERHLQRRDGNVLFPLERRSVTNKSIEEAREGTAQQILKAWNEMK